MHAAPAIEQLDAKFSIYVLTDEHGRVIATGSKDALEVLLFITRTARCSAQTNEDTAPRRAHATNVRSAILV